MTRPFRARALVTGAVVAVALAGCSGSSGGGSGGGSAGGKVLTPTLENGVQVFAVSADASLAFSATELDAHPGKIRVDFSVAQPSAPHNFVVNGVAGARTPVLDPGTKASTSFTITTPGSYQFVCTIHSNMKGTLKIS